MSELNIEIVETIPAHVRMMAHDMHESTAQTAIALGTTPHVLLWKSYKKSIICKTAFFNGKIAAIWGLSGELFGDKGHPWLIMSPVVDDHPMRVAFIYRKEVKNFQTMFPILEDYIDINSTKTLKMLELMGFNFDPEPIQHGAVQFVRAWRE